MALSRCSSVEIHTRDVVFLIDRLSTVSCALHLDCRFQLWSWLWNTLPRISYQHSAVFRKGKDSSVVTSPRYLLYCPRSDFRDFGHCSRSFFNSLCWLEPFIPQAGNGAWTTYTYGNGGGCKLSPACLTLL